MPAYNDSMIASAYDVRWCVATTAPTERMIGSVHAAFSAGRRGFALGDAHEHEHEQRKRERFVGELRIEEDEARVRAVHGRCQAGNVRGATHPLEEQEQAQHHREPGHAEHDYARAEDPDTVNVLNAAVTLCETRVVRRHRQERVVAEEMVRPHDLVGVMHVQELVAVQEVERRVHHLHEIQRHAEQHDECERARRDARSRDAKRNAIGTKIRHIPTQKGACEVLRVERERP